MYRSSVKRLTATLASAVACLFLFAASSDGATRTPTVKHSAKNDRLRSLREVTAVTRPPGGPNRMAARNERPNFRGPGTPGVDPQVQRHFGTSAPTPQLNFDGSTAADNTDFLGFTLAPPDTEGDVGAG